MTCIYCDQEIKKDDLVFWIPIEVPYGNIIVHRECWKTNRYSNFIQENSEKVYNYIVNKDRKGKK